MSLGTFYQMTNLYKGYLMSDEGLRNCGCLSERGLFLIPRNRVKILLLLEYYQMMLRSRLQNNKQALYCLIQLTGEQTET